MKVKMKTLYSSPKRNVQPGEVADFEKEVALQLIAGGYAEEVKEPVEKKSKATVEPEVDSEPEVAALSQPETATLKHPRSRKR